MGLWLVNWTKVRPRGCQCRGPVSRASLHSPYTTHSVSYYRLTKHLCQFRFMAHLTFTACHHKIYNIFQIHCTSLLIHNSLQTHYVSLDFRRTSELVSVSRLTPHFWLIVCHKIDDTRQTRCVSSDTTCSIHWEAGLLFSLLCSRQHQRADRPSVISQGRGEAGNREMKVTERQRS